MHKGTNRSGAHVECGASQMAPRAPNCAYNGDRDNHGSERGWSVWQGDAEGGVEPKGVQSLITCGATRLGLSLRF
jgi:hypothetical protein